MRIEEILAMALEKVNNDRYLLSYAVGQRADELSRGAKPLLDNASIKNMKYTDIAINSSNSKKGALKLIFLAKK